jgi:hypothetical protein
MAQRNVLRHALGKTERQKIGEKKQEILEDLRVWVLWFPED